MDTTQQSMRIYERHPEQPTMRILEAYDIDTEVLWTGEVQVH